MKSVIVIGGGVIGLCSAYYLQKEGCQVTIVDQSNMDAGASYINAGYLSPSHIIPLAAPGVMKKGLKWMFNSSSPLYIKPRFDIEFLKWVSKVVVEDPTLIIVPSFTKFGSPLVPETEPPVN